VLLLVNKRKENVLFVFQIWSDALNGWLTTLVRPEVTPKTNRQRTEKCTQFVHSDFATRSYPILDVDTSKITTKSAPTIFTTSRPPPFIAITPQQQHLPF
jgi:hypothetical protein